MTRYKVVDSKGVGIRTFNNKQAAYYFVSLRPEFQIVAEKRNTFQEMLNTVGECLL